MQFTFSRKHNILPNITLEGANLEFVNETKLLGLTITNNCKWDANTQMIVSKGNSRLWFLRRLKLLGASKATLLEIYKLFCRSTLEIGAPVWSGSLTKKNKQNIERVQKNALRIIYGPLSCTYEELLESIGETTLETRRDHLSLSFARKCLRNEKFKHWFPRGVSTRKRNHFLEPQAKTKRFSNSAIPYMIRLLNLNS